MKIGGALAMFEQDNSSIKYAGLDVYAKYKIGTQDSLNVTSRQNATIDSEQAVKVCGDGIKSFSGIKFVEYMLMHGKQPYYLAYVANAKRL
jgi:hypothetical protein